MVLNVHRNHIEKGGGMEVGEEGDYIPIAALWGEEGDYTPTATLSPSE